MTADAGLNMRAHTKYISVYYLSWIAKDTIIELGMICACILALYQISTGAPIGNFVMLVAYWGNFTGGPFARSTVDPSRWLIPFRETYHFRRYSAQNGPGPHRRRGDA